jgi:outer membrane protein assembly factor BamB
MRRGSARLTATCLAIAVYAAGCDHASKRRPADDFGYEAPADSTRPRAQLDAGRDAALATVPDAALCDPPLLRCGTQCVDVATSDEHCGGCNNRCSAGTECVQRRCLPRCTETTTRCGMACVDLTSDAKNCGDCGSLCFSDQVCSESECGCATGKASCAGACVEALPGACGVCGDECPPELPCDDGANHASDWPTFAGDVSRTGYNKGEQGRPPLTSEWAISLLDDPLNPVVVSGSRVFVSGQTRSRGKGPLFALDPKTGTPLWSHDFGNVSGVGQPTAFHCRVYVQHGGGSMPSRIWSLKADSGDALWSRPFAAQWDSHLSPTVTESSIYVQGGSTGGLQAFARANGELLFQSMAGQTQSSAWVAAAYGGEIYTFVAGKLKRHDAATGVVLDTIGVSVQGALSASTGPVFSPEGVVYLAAPPTLYAFEALSKRLLWMQAGKVSGMPALAEGRVLAFDGQQLTAFDAATGTLQWRSLDTEGLVNAPVVAAGFAYVASATTTYAIDLRDGSVAWRVEAAGRLSIGGGRLFIAGQEGILRSYLLTQP